MTFIAVGKQAEASALPDDLRAREEAPRKRKNLEENFFRGAWGKGWEKGWEKGGGE